MSTIIIINTGNEDELIVSFLIKDIQNINELFTRFIELQKICFNVSIPVNPIGEYVLMSLYYIIPDNVKSYRKHVFNPFKQKSVGINTFYYSDEKIYTDIASLYNSNEYKYLFYNITPNYIINSIEFKLSFNKTNDFIDIYDLCSTFKKARNLKTNKTLTEESLTQFLLFII